MNRSPLPTVEELEREYEELSRVRHARRALVFLRERASGIVVVGIASVDGEGRITRIGSILRIGAERLDDVSLASANALRLVTIPPTRSAVPETPTNGRRRPGVPRGRVAP
jgi:hypothetical protein